MVSADDSPCTDATEASVTSLQSDSRITDSNTRKPRLEPTNGDNNIPQEYNFKDCKCYAIRSAAKFGVPPEKCGITGTSEQSPPKEPLKDQYSTKQIESTVSCLCRTHKISAYTLPLKYKKHSPSCLQPFWCRFKWKWPKKKYLERKDNTYEVKFKPKQCPHYAEPFMYCEVAEGIPNKKRRDDLEMHKVAKDEEKLDKKEDATERIDIYYFDHGNSAYYRTTDSPPTLITEKCAEKTDQAATRFWAEIFGTIHIGTAFVTAFILQLFRFILYSIIRPLTVGILQLFGDYFIKPFLSIIFNALVQPALILLYNIATSLRDLCEPIAEAIGLFLKELANLCAAIRIVEVKQNARDTPPIPCT